MDSQSKFYLSPAGASFYGNIISLKEAGSTNDIAWEEVAKGFRSDCIAVVADSQTDGRGRYRRVWHSPPGMGLWLSWAVKVKHGEVIPAAVTAVAAIAIAETLRNDFDINAGLKWPNDIVVGDSKIAGVLVETKEKFNTPEEKTFVIGAGINLNFMPEDFPEELRNIAVSMKMIKQKHVDRDYFFGRLSDNFRNWYNIFAGGGYDIINKAWVEYSSLIGSRVKIFSHGADYEGRVEDVNMKEGIFIRLDSGIIKHFRSEFVELVKMPPS